MKTKERQQINGLEMASMDYSVLATSRKGIKIDARVKYLALVIGNIMCFTLASFVFEVAFVLLMIVLIAVQGHVVKAVKALLIYGFLLCFYFLMQTVELGVIEVLIVVILVAKRVATIIFSAYLLLGTTSSQEMIGTMHKMYLPKAINLSLCVVIRYFPAFIEDIRQTSRAIKLRNVKGIKKFTSYYMPMLSSASRISDEITEAAITRGIENPCKRSSIFEYKLRLIDWFLMAVFVAILVLSFVLEVNLL